DLRRAAHVGGESVSEDDLLQQVPEGYPLRGVGTARVFRYWDARWIQNAPQLRGSGTRGLSGTTNERARRSRRAYGDDNDYEKSCCILGMPAPPRHSWRGS